MADRDDKPAASPGPATPAEPFRDDVAAGFDFFHHSPDPIFVADETGRYLDVNRAACEMTGYSRDELLAMSLPELVAPEALADGLAHFAGVRETGHSSGELLGVRKGGERFYIAVDAVVAGENRYVAYCKDITDRRRTEEYLRSSEERFRTLLTNSKGVIFMIDTRGIFILSEGKGLELLGLEPGEVVGQSALEMYEDYPEILTGIEEALAGRTHSSVVKVGAIYFDAFYSPYRDREGRIAGALGMATDVTARIHAEEERLRLAANMQWAQKLESLGVLAGGVAHDFNNLLVSILGNADVLARELEPASAGHESSVRIAAAAGQAASLCRQLLAYAGRDAIETREVDLNDAVREMTSLLSVAISKKIELTWMLADDLPAVDADATQLRQVAMNMITNASEAIGEGHGAVRVSTHSRELDREDLRGCYAGEGRPPGRYVVLRVEDDGCGMDAETIQRIFDPFYTTKFTGRGLGMATVLGIVQRHGGAIRIESTPGRGSVVEALFPARGTIRREAAPAPARAVTADGPGLVLVVDDEPAVRETVRLMLGDLGIETVLAKDGLEALERVREQGPSIDCVLLDMTMPRMGGVECLRALRELAPDLPVVLCSGYSESDIAGEISADQLTRFIQKPYRLGELSAVLNNATAASPRSDRRPSASAGTAARGD